MVLGDVTLGRDASVWYHTGDTAQAVLPEGMEVPPGSLVLEVPARIVRPVNEALRRRIDTAWQHYLQLAREHRDGKRVGGGR